jgi:hypothetical protein
LPRIQAEDHQVSEIIHQLRGKIEQDLEEYARLGEAKKLFAIKNKLDQAADQIGRQHGIQIQLNYPNKKALLDLQDLGLMNLSIYVHRTRKRFIGPSTGQILAKLSSMYPRGKISEVGFGWDGYHIDEGDGRITVLPGAVHLWRRIRERELRLLDWLFSEIFCSTKKNMINTELFNEHVYLHGMHLPRRFHHNGRSIYGRVGQDSREENAGNDSESSESC